MANWLNQLQSLLGQSSSSASSSADQGLGKLLVPGALGGLAGLLVANKSARKLLTKYGTNALLVGGGAVAGTVLWNKYKDKIRAAHQDEPQFGAQSTPLDERTERLILALVFAAKSDGHIDARERAAIDQQLREAGVEEQGRVLIEQAIEQPLIQFHQMHTFLCCFVFQFCDESRPSSIAYRTSQMVIFHHICRFQCLDNYRLVFVNNCAR